MGDVDGDRMRDAVGSLARATNAPGSFGVATGVFHGSVTDTQYFNDTGLPSTIYSRMDFALSKMVPVGDKTASRRWGSLACVYLGRPAS